MFLIQAAKLIGAGIAVSSISLQIIGRGFASLINKVRVLKANFLELAWILNLRMKVSWFNFKYVFLMSPLQFLEKILDT